MRSLLISALALALAAPALAQTPPPETIDFEGLGTPIAYKPGETVPASARLQAVDLAGGGRVRFRSRNGAKYVALVTHFGTTGVAAVSKKGRIQVGRYMEIRIRKSPGARFDSFTPIQAGARLVDDQGTTTPDDDEIAFDNPGDAAFFLYDTRGTLYPSSGQLQLVRSDGDPQNLVKEPYDLTTTSLDFRRILIAAGLQIGPVVLDDFVVSYGH